MGIEFELKYRASEAAFAAIRQAYPQPEELLQMQTTYYDTPDGSLSARHWTLRSRLENGRNICTLKTPAGSARQEWETEAADIFAALPAFREMGCPEELFTLTQTGLRPICGARFTRIAKTVAVNGSILEIAMDSGVLTGGSRQIPLTELEVELKSGREEDCLAFARELAATFGLEAEPYSKFRRALDLYKGETNGL